MSNPREGFFKALAVTPHLGRFEFYVTFMVSTAIEFPADTLAILGINLLGRRWSASLSMLLCAATMAATAATPGQWNGFNGNE